MFTGIRTTTTVCVVYWHGRCRAECCVFCEGTTEQKFVIRFLGKVFFVFSLVLYKVVLYEAPATLYAMSCVLPAAAVLNKRRGRDEQGSEQYKHST